MDTLYELIQVSVGSRERLSMMPSAKEWDDIFSKVSLLGLTGITYVGVKKLMEQPGCTLTKHLLVIWSGCVVQLKDENERVTARGIRVLGHFQDAGFKAIILKGQSHLDNYPAELRDLRNPGDIDVWVKGVSKRQVYQFIQKDFPDEHYGYLHISFPVYSNLPVEIHIRPAYLCNPFRNHRLQQWADSFDFESLNDIDQFRAFNAIYQPLHLYKHLIREGITVRQLLDYYFLLKQRPHTDEIILQQLGIDVFCKDLQSVVMYLFENVPIVSASVEKLLKEVMIDISTAGTVVDNELKRTWQILKIYPNEILWRPYFWLFQKLWKFFIK